jgi:DNA-binding NarL/FixJ family response regulator
VEKLPVKVFVIDECPLIAEGLHSLFEVEKLFKLVGYCNHSCIYSSVFNNQRPDCIILDHASWSGGLGRLIDMLRSNQPSAQLVLFSHVLDQSCCVLGSSLGVRGFISKSAEANELLLILKNVCIGGEEGFAGGLQKDRHLKLALTGREIEVLGLMANGYSSKEIAGFLSVCTRTIESHRAHISKKTGRSGIANMVRYAIEHGLRNSCFHK